MSAGVVNRISTPVYGSASINLEGLASGLTNAGANICVDTEIFLQTKLPME